MTVNTREAQPIYSTYQSQPIYQDLLKDFVDNLEERLEQCTKALEEKSWKDLAKQMHQLRGAAATYGYPALSEIAARIELEAGGTDIPEDSIKAAMEAARITSAGMAAALESH